MKSDIFHAYDPTSVRESVLGVRMTRSPQAMKDSEQASIPEIGYKLPFSSDLIRFSERLNGRNDDIPSKATCPVGRLCPQYGHPLIFPRKCYYEAQCPLPLLFCVKHHREGEEKAVKSNLVVWHGFTHPTQSFRRRLSSTLSRKIAFNDPNKVMTNFGWMKKDEVPYHRRHERGSQ